MQISIITVTYNSQDYLQEAINSYQQQDYDNKELVLVDGLSKDATPQIISAHKSLISKSISEPDKGIYDALNKGINLADGDVIGILHSDDYFASPNVLSQVAEKFKNNPNLQAVYGDLQYVDRTNPSKVIRNWKSGNYERSNFLKGWMPPHPALFIKKACFKNFGNYNLKYKSAADYDLILRFLYTNQIITDYIPEVLVKMRVGGLSNQSFKNRLIANNEDYLALKDNQVPNPRWVALIKPISKLSQYFK